VFLGNKPIVYQAFRVNVIMEGKNEYIYKTVDLEKSDRDINLSSDELSMKDLYIKLRNITRYLLSKWIIILCFIGIGSILGFVYTKYRTPIYTASTTFVLEESGTNGPGGLGQYAGIASMVGLDLGNGGGGIFQGDNLLELYRSRNMLKKTLLSQYQSDGKAQLLIDKYVEVYNLRKEWDNNPKLRGVTFVQKNKGVATRIQDSLISSIASNIRQSILFVGKPDKKLNIIEVDVKSKNEDFAYAFNKSIVQNVNDFYVQTKTKKSIDNLNILQHQADSIRRSLNGAISNVAASIDANPNANLSRQILRVPSQRRQIDAEANKAILTELVKNLEISKVSLRRETPLLQIIDDPNLPLEKDIIIKSKGIVVGATIGAFLIIVYLLLRKLFSNLEL
jgi:hypothetical protein